MDPDRLLADLDPEQREVATAVRGPVCVVAGAGTGKTRAITHRIAYGVAAGVYQPAEVLAVTFTTRAAGQLRSRLAALGAPGVQARTFHSAALRQARYFWPRVYGGELPPVTDSKLGLVAEAARRCRLATDSARLRDLASEVEWAKVSNVRPDDYAGLAQHAGRRLASYDHRTVAAVLATYEEVKRERGRIDLEDVLLCAVACLADDDAVAAEVRRQYRWLVVDEYQDVSPVQQALLDLWLGDRNEVCVVGDPQQTIYSFAGASPRYLREFVTRYPKARVIRLVRDYRSTPQVVAVANRLGAGAGAARDRVPLRAQRPAGPEPAFAEHPDELAEAAAAAATVEQWLAMGVPAAEVAVLYRVNAQSEPLEQALAERGISYAVRGGERFFQRPEVRQAAMLVKGAALGSSPAGAGLVGDVRAVLAGLGWQPEPPSGRGAVRERWESLAAVVALAEELAADPDADLATLSAELDRRAQVQDAPVGAGVTLATLHAAKGLEWDAVALVGVQEGTLPIGYAETPEQVREEERLLYVGITRARAHLAVSWSVARAPGGRPTRGPSRFLDGVRPAVSAALSGAAGSRRRPRRARTHVTRCRVCSAPLADAAARKLGRCSDCPGAVDERLFGRLREWRTTQAAAERLPAYCVFTDATLVAIAESRPRDSAALGRVSGIGRTKLDKYGAEVLALCADNH